MSGRVPENAAVSLERSLHGAKEMNLRDALVGAHGAHIPALGFGTYRMSANDVHRIVPAALRAGRHDRAPIRDPA